MRIEIIKWASAFSIAFFLATTIGLFAGFPEYPEEFRDRSEQLHRAAVAGENMDQALVDEHTQGSRSRLPEPRYGLIGDVVRVVQWHVGLLCALYLLALMSIRPRILIAIIGTLFTAPLFLYCFGVTPSLGILIVVMGYALLAWLWGVTWKTT